MGERPSASFAVRSSNGRAGHSKINREMSDRERVVEGWYGMGRREVIRNIATVVPVLGVSLGPHDNVGGGFCVGAVLGRDFGMTVGPPAGRISGTKQWCWVRPGRRYPIRERRGRRRG